MTRLHSVIIHREETRTFNSRAAQEYIYNTLHTIINLNYLTHLQLLNLKHLLGDFSEL